MPGIETGLLGLPACGLVIVAYSCFPVVPCLTETS
jgi:hypothetical protein